MSSGCVESHSTLRFQNYHSMPLKRQCMTSHGECESFQTMAYDTLQNYRRWGRYVRTRAWRHQTSTVRHRYIRHYDVNRTYMTRWLPAANQSRARRRGTIWRCCRAATDAAPKCTLHVHDISMHITCTWMYMCTHICAVMSRVAVSSYWRPRNVAA